MPLPSNKAVAPIERRNKMSGAVIKAQRAENPYKMLSEYSKPNGLYFPPTVEKEKKKIEAAFAAAGIPMTRKLRRRIETARAKQYEAMAKQERACLKGMNKPFNSVHSVQFVASCISHYATVAEKGLGGGKTTISARDAKAIQKEVERTYARIGEVKLVDLEETTKNWWPDSMLDRVGDEITQCIAKSGNKLTKEKQARIDAAMERVKALPKASFAYGCSEKTGLVVQDVTTTTGLRIPGTRVRVSSAPFMLKRG
jgi:hypothetical protein